MPSIGAVDHFIYWKTFACRCHSNIIIMSQFTTSLTPVAAGLLACQKNSYLRTLTATVLDCVEHVPTRFILTAYIVHQLYMLRDYNETVAKVYNIYAGIISM